MATRLVKLKGKGYWAKVFESNRDLKGYNNELEDVGGQTTIDLDIDDRHFALLQKSRSMLEGRESPDNPDLRRIKFKRKWQENYGGGAPKVERADGTAWDLEIDGLIGNGSDVEVTLSVYDTKNRRIVGTRLEAVRVINNIPYEGSKVEVLSIDDDEPAAAPQRKPVMAEAEDEIPF